MDAHPEILKDYFGYGITSTLMEKHKYLNLGITINRKYGEK
jgi:hypothetical protein